MPVNLLYEQQEMYCDFILAYQSIEGHEKFIVSEKGPETIHEKVIVTYIHSI